MQLKSILNRIQKQPGFVYGKAKLRPHGLDRLRIDMEIRARKGSMGVCSVCMKRRPIYDRLRPRYFEFVPLWGIAVFFLYAPRRCDCPSCGVKVELMPWANGKSPTTTAFAWFLASWARVLSWQEVARRFRVSWSTVFDAVTTAVMWGLRHRNLDGIQSIGVDELAWKKGHKYLTVVWQIDHHCKRLLWIGRDRTAQSFERFFSWLGPERSREIRFVASDMWRAFLGVVARRASAAVHVLDRFHVAKLLGDAVDKVRREEVRELRRLHKEPVLTKARWILLKRSTKLSDAQRSRLAELTRANLRTMRAYLLKEDLQRFWSYKKPAWAGRFLDRWCSDALRSRIEPVHKVARTLRQHRSLLLNWFRAREAFAQGATEGLNNKARTVTKRAYGFRSYRHAEIAMFHAMGDLPEPDWLTHKFT